MTEARIRIADWRKDNADIRMIRTNVFIDEQAVPPELEWDDNDSGASHFLAFVDGRAVATARLLPDGHIGRVAVLKSARGQKIGYTLMQAAIAEAERRGLQHQRLSAQVHATRFYERLGFIVVSGEHLDAGIPHVDMTRQTG